MPTWFWFVLGWVGFCLIVAGLNGRVKDHHDREFGDDWP
jgi:hypothetical protein